MNTNSVKPLIAGCAIVGLLSFGFPGCDSAKHKMTETPPGKKTICRLCYDEIVKVPPHPRYGPMGGTRRIHKCTECKSDATYYDENGILKIRCAGCAPEGMDCDKCLPPD